MARKPLERLTDEELEGMLLEATSQGVPGRAAMARVTAIRTILARRPRISDGEAEANARRALELVNATRGPDRQLTEIHPVDVSSVLADPEWAPLVASDEEIGLVGGPRHAEASDDDDY